MAVIICKNCNHHFKGNYCPECGQSAKVEPITVKYFLHDIPHSILHIDKGFFYTLGKLFTNPGGTLVNYLDGQRVKHFRPFGFVVILSTICTLLIKACDEAINLRYMQQNPGEKILFANSLFGKYPSVLIFIMIPLLSLVTWFFFRKNRYNYWEHFLINTYLAAYLNIFFLLINVFRVIKYYTTGGLSVNYTIFMFIFMAYYGHTFGRMMWQKGTLLKNIVLTLLMNFFLATLYMTAFSLTGLMSAWWGK